MHIGWVTVFFDTPAAEESTSAQFWCAVTRTIRSERRGTTGQFATLLPAQGDPYLRIQRVDNGPRGHHLDLHTDEPAAVVRRALDLGADLHHDEEGLAVLTSPGGFAHCIVGEHPSHRPPPVADSRTATSRVDQLCLDIPPGRYAAECDYWANLTDWSLRPGALPEFSYLQRPDGIPIRLLLQRCEQGADRVGAHLDLACSDLPATLARHVALGAGVVAQHEFWTVLADPVGRRYCLTARDPESGQLTRTVGR